ncbi:bacterial transcriptional activator domain-containing protein, partial [Bradyrhizobium uaiense]
STILWRLRHLGDSGAQTTTRQLLLIEPNGDVRINGRDVVEIDLVDFEAAVKRCHIRQGQASADDVAVLTRCVDLYAGDFLRELDLEWVAEKRQYLRQCYLDILQFLVEYHNDVGRYDEVITYADRFLRVDPYLEAIHVFMIKACLSTGRRSLAAARALACRRVFTEELGVAIEGEAQRLISCLASTSSSQSKARTKCQVDRRASHRVDDRSLVQLRDACSQVVNVCSTLLHEASDREPGAAAFQSHPPRKSVER